MKKADSDGQDDCRALVEKQQNMLLFDDQNVISSIKFTFEPLFSTAKNSISSPTSIYSNVTDKAVISCHLVSPGYERWLPVPFLIPP